MKKDCNARYHVDTTWNSMRINLGLTYNNIVDHFNEINDPHSRGWFCGIFSGLLMPPTNVIAELCRWFTNLGSEISFELGKEEFRKAWLTHKPDKHRKMVGKSNIEENVKDIAVTAVKKEANMKGRKGRKSTTEIGQLIQAAGFTFDDLGAKIGIKPSTLKAYVQGKYRPNDDVIIDITEAINNDPENIERLFKEAYNNRHHKNQVTIEETIVEPPVVDESGADEFGRVMVEINPPKTEDKPYESNNDNRLIKNVYVRIKERDIPLFNEIVNSCSIWPVFSDTPHNECLCIGDILELIEMFSQDVVEYDDILHWTYKRVTWGAYTTVVAFAIQHEYVKMRF